MSNDCIFCRIGAGEVPAQVVFEDSEIVAFRDLAPQAPVHVLLIPRRHLASVAVAAEADGGLLGRLVLAAAAVARQLGIEPGGYRLVTNSGRDAGQSVHHLHLHLLGGRALGWPPG